MEYGTNRLRRGLLAACWLWAGCAISAHAAVFYGGPTKGFAGESVELTINAAAGTVLEGIDIVPNLDDVPAYFQFVTFTTTMGLTEGGSPFCTDVACSVFYVPSKMFDVDTLLATLRFDIAPDAPVGSIPFDAGVFIGDATSPLPIPEAVGFEVLAIPEPSTWALFAAGLVGLGAVARRRSDSFRRTYRTAYAGR